MGSFPDLRFNLYRDIFSCQLLQVQAQGATAMSGLFLLLQVSGDPWRCILISECTGDDWTHNGQGPVFSASSNSGSGSHHKERRPFSPLGQGPRLESDL